MKKNKYLISILEKEVIEINDVLEQLQNLPSKIDNILNLFNGNNIINITVDDINFIKENLNGYKLSNLELEFMETICNFDDETKKFISSVGFDEKQNALILNLKRNIELIKNNLNDFKVEEFNKRLEECKQTISNLKNNQINLITNLDFIKELLNKYNVSLKDQIDIFFMINQINLNIYKSFNQSVEVEDEILSETDFEETNLNEDEIRNIFLSYGIDFDKIYNSEKKHKFKKRLLKYGNVENISQILSYIVNKKELNFIFEEVEILTKVLLYSSVDKIEWVIKEAKENGISEIIRKYPVVLFPPVRERNLKNNEGGNSQYSNVSGSMNNFINNVNLLKELDIPIYEAYKKCSTFFTKSVKNAKQVLKLLNLYGINSVENKENITFSVLRSSKNVSKRIDIAIENGCYEYCKQNLSRLCDDSVNFYRIKHAKKIHEENSTLKSNFSPFKLYLNGSNKISLATNFSNKESIYGDKPEDTYKLYGAVNIEIENKEKYDAILNLNENINISEISLENNIIKQLDELYKDERDSLIYNFNGIIISRYNVLRYFETLISEPNVVPDKDMLLYLITLNSMLNSEELDTIKNCIDKVKFTRRSLK